MKESAPTKIRTVGTLGAVAIIAAICAPLAMPASAALDSGYFFVQAHDKDGFKGIAGMNGELGGNPGGGNPGGGNPGGGGSNPGGGNTNANDEGGISSSDEKATAAAEMIGSADQVAYTSSGLVVYTGGGLADSFFRVGADGSVSKMNITGDLEGARLRSSDLRSDGAEGLYLSAFTENAGTWYPNAIYRIAADGTSKRITTVNNPDPDAGGANIIYSYSVGADGAVYFIGSADEYVPGWGMWGRVSGLWKVDQASTKSTRIVRSSESEDGWQGYRGDFAVAADGTVFTVEEGGPFNFGVTRISGSSAMTLPQSKGDGWFNPSALLLDPAGNLYAQDDHDDNRFVYRVDTTTGELTQVSKFRDANWLQLDSASFSPDGTAYSVDGWGMVSKITAAGQKYAITLER